MEELSVYIQNQLSRARDRLLSYTQNKAGTEYHKRSIFLKLQKYINAFINTTSEERWLIIPGLRGVGKTTILAQLYFYLVHKDFKPLFISLNEVKHLFNATLQNVLDVYEEIIGINFERLDKPLFLLIDEIQIDPEWAQTLTTIYNRTKNIFIVCSGSSAVQLQTDADTARRAIQEKLYPMNFTEYEMLKNDILPIPHLKHTLKQSLYFSNTAKEVFDALKTLEQKQLAYWTKVDRIDIQEFLTIGTLPFAIQKEERIRTYERIFQMIDNIITKDIQSLGFFDFNTLGVIKRLLFIIAENDAISVNKLSQTLNINHLTTTNILETLEKAELLIKVSAFGANIRAIRKPAKYLFMSPAIRSTFLNIAGIESTLLVRQGRLLEDIMGEYFYREFVRQGIGTLSYDCTKDAADFILQILNKNQIAIEIGIGQKTFKQVISTMKRIKCNYGIVIHKGKLSVNETLNIVKVPIEYILLS